MGHYSSIWKYKMITIQLLWHKTWIIDNIRYTNCRCLKCEKCKSSSKKMLLYIVNRPPFDIWYLTTVRHHTINIWKILFWLVTFDSIEKAHHNMSRFYVLTLEVECIIECILSSHDHSGIPYYALRLLHWAMKIIHVFIMCTISKVEFGYVISNVVMFPAVFTPLSHVTKYVL